MGCCASSSFQKPHEDPNALPSGSTNPRIATDADEVAEATGNPRAITRGAAVGLSSDAVILSDSTSVPKSSNVDDHPRSPSSSSVDTPWLSTSSRDRTKALDHSHTLPEIDENSPSAIDHALNTPAGNVGPDPSWSSRSHNHRDYKDADAQREAQLNKSIISKVSAWKKKANVKELPLSLDATQEEALVPLKSQVSPNSSKKKADIIKRMDTLAELANSAAFDQYSSNIEKASLWRSSPSMFSTGNQFSSADTMIIFDWDDTLCPSFWLRLDPRVLWDKRAAKKDVDVQKLMTKYQRSAVRLLKAAKMLGHVEILTCSRRPWVYTSSSSFMPKIENEVRDVTVIYANETKRIDTLDEDSEDFIPTITENSLTEALDKFYSQRPRKAWRNIISISDGHREHDAMLRATMNQSQCCVKCVKLISSPSIQILTSELTVIRSWLLGITDYNQSININLESSQEDIERYTSMFFQGPVDI